MKTLTLQADGLGYHAISSYEVPLNSGPLMPANRPVHKGMTAYIYAFANKQQVALCWVGSGIDFAWVYVDTLTRKPIT